MPTGLSDYTKANVIVDPTTNSSRAGVSSTGDLSVGITTSDVLGIGDSSSTLSVAGGTIHADVSILSSTITIISGSSTLNVNGGTIQIGTNTGTLGIHTINILALNTGGTTGTTFNAVTNASTLLGANANRTYALIQNTSGSSQAAINFGGSGLTFANGIIIDKSLGSYEINATNRYTGVINVISSGGTIDLRVIDF